MSSTSKALVTALIFLLLVIALVIALHKSARECAPAVDAAILSEFSSGIEKFVADSLMHEYEPSTVLVEEPSSEETTTVRETTTAEPTTERKTIAQTTTTEVYEEDYYDYHGGYIGTFELTAYEWTGERMANGEYPYYGACASNYFALGTVLYIEGYGTFTVCDRSGPSMGNNIIDIYLGDPDACYEFGVRTADVYYG